MNYLVNKYSIYPRSPDAPRTLYTIYDTLYIWNRKQPWTRSASRVPRNQNAVYTPLKCTPKHATKIYIEGGSNASYMQPKALHARTISCAIADRTHVVRALRSLLRVAAQLKVQRARSTSIRLCTNYTRGLPQASALWFLEVWCSVVSVFIFGLGSFRIVYIYS